MMERKKMRMERKRIQMEKEDEREESEWFRMTHLSSSSHYNSSFLSSIPFLWNLHLNLSSKSLIHIWQNPKGRKWWEKYSSIIIAHFTPCFIFLSFIFSSSLSLRIFSPLFNRRKNFCEHFFLTKNRESLRRKLNEEKKIMIKISLTWWSVLQVWSNDPLDR